MITLIAPHVRFLGKVLRTSGPYLLLEILLPGGTLFALLLFYYQRRQGSGARLPLPHGVAVVMQAFDRAIAFTFDPVVGSAWRGVDNDDGLEALAMVPVK